MKIIKVGGYVQNRIRLNSVNNTSARTPVKTKSYESLEKVNLPSGFYFGIADKEYPINSDSVTSFADGADYKNDPMQAIANAPKRVNLGDITEAQEFLKNPLNFARVYNEVKDKLAEYYNSQKPVQGNIEPVENEKKGENE